MATTRSRAQRTLALALGALALALGSVALIAAPSPAASIGVAASTTQAPASSLGCAPTEITNQVFRSGTTYIDANTPTINVTTSGSYVRWTTVSPTVQRRVIAYYTKTGFTTYTGTSPTQLAKTTASRGNLAQVTVCTTPPPAATTSSSSTSSTTTTVAPGSFCPAGQVQNTAVFNGAQYLDAASPGLTFSFGGTTAVRWTLDAGKQQKAGDATYTGAQISIPSSARQVAKFRDGAPLWTVRICTTV